jgi:hypothetical protein
MMNNRISRATCVGLLLLGACLSFGQRNRSQYREADRQARELVQQATQWLASLSDPLAIIYMKDVQRDIHLGLAARNRLAFLRDEHARALQQPGASSSALRSEHRKETQEKVDQYLTKDQKKRLKQLTLQLRGEAAALDPSVQKELEISADQRSQIQTRVSRRNSEINRLRTRIARGEITATEFPKFVKQIVDQCNADIRGYLTAQQEAQLKEMFGPPIGTES